MLTKHFPQILILLFLLCSACAKPKPNPFLISPNYNIQILERKDHQFCSALKIDHNQTTLMQSRQYWGCRLSMTKHHILKSRSSKAITHNLGLNDLINKIKVRIANLPESIIHHANSKIDEKQHKKCLELGYEVATEDNGKIDDYFSCRSALIEDYKLLPPYRKSQYMKYPNKHYNLNFAITRRIENKLAQYNEQKKLYPTCVKYNIYNPNFKLCTEAQDASKECHQNIEKSRYKKELKDKINCQRLSYVHFPNRLIKFEEEKENKANQTNYKSDYYNNNNFAALGLDEESFQSKEEEKEEDKTGKIPVEVEKSINNDNELYSKFEITKLREKYILKCQQSVDHTMKKFIEEEKFKCEQLKKFKKIGE